MDLQTPLQYVKGIGPARAEMLASKNLLTIADLLFYAPFRYEDRSNTKTIAQLAPGEKAAVTAWVVSAKLSGFRRRSLGLFDVHFEDASGAELIGLWSKSFSCIGYESLKTALQATSAIFLEASS